MRLKFDRSVYRKFSNLNHLLIKDLNKENLVKCEKFFRLVLFSHATIRKKKTNVKLKFIIQLNIFAKFSFNSYVRTFHYSHTHTYKYI